MGVGQAGGLKEDVGVGEGSWDIPGLTEVALKEQDAAIYPRNQTAHLLRNRLYFTHLQDLR